MTVRPKEPEVPLAARISRRQFAKGSALAALCAGWMAGPARSQETAPTQRETPIPLKIGHRAASMKMVGNFDVFKVARQIPGLMGVELQVTSGKPNLRDWDAVRRYKREANRWGVMVPSLAGVWDKGVSILNPAAAEPNLVQAIRVAEFLGAGVALLAFFKQNAPDMADESSYGPVVELLQRVAPGAANAGVTLGFENSLSPADNKKLVDLVGHPAVKVYYDPHNMAFYGYAEEAVPGVALLGKGRICQVHVKNGDQLLEAPGPVDWAAALNALDAIQYDGWYVFESQHASGLGMIEDTAKNVAFLQSHCHMPSA